MLSINAEDTHLGNSLTKTFLLPFCLSGPRKVGRLVLRRKIPHYRAPFRTKKRRKEPVGRQPIF
jgi:hypothetical protein